jgi:hypothetical protein
MHKLAGLFMGAEQPFNFQSQGGVCATRFIEISWALCSRQFDGSLEDFRFLHDARPHMDTRQCIMRKIGPNPR